MSCLATIVKARVEKRSKLKATRNLIHVVWEHLVITTRKELKEYKAMQVIYAGFFR